MNRPEIGKYRLIPKGTFVWSTKLQSNISFDKDMVVRITHTIISDDASFFGELCIILFPMTIPGVITMAHGEISTRLDQTTPYEIPNPQFLDFTYSM